MTRSPNVWRSAFIILAVVAVCGFAYMSLSIAHAEAERELIRDGFDRRQVALSLLRKSIPDMVRASPLSQTSLLAILQKHSRGSPMTVTAGSIEVDLMRFEFSRDGSFKQVQQTEDYGFKAGDSPMGRSPAPEL